MCVEAGVEAMTDSSGVYTIIPDPDIITQWFTPSPLFLSEGLNDCSQDTGEEATIPGRLQHF